MTSHTEACELTERAAHLMRLGLAVDMARNKGCVEVLIRNLDDTAHALSQPDLAHAVDKEPEPVLTGKHPFPICICVRCGPPWRDEVPGWAEEFHGPFKDAAWMSLCPTCGDKRCPGAVDHRMHPAPDAPSDELGGPVELGDEPGGDAMRWTGGAQ